MAETKADESAAKILRISLRYLLLYRLVPESDLTFSQADARELARGMLNWLEDEVAKQSRKKR